ncbi:Conserved_hypothetical protein [Hexamita inflata]|uniref:EF-hand domain-containing protein n=1 Tax=Hexamita inflata TaxID=28002 RepID=A0AA86UFB8_9EUKA|nr:Conserved hypothetical protein [Hexamita inflata]CAI9949646.1 Conserved hypothetical protein [Hexamita inflata]
MGNESSKMDKNAIIRAFKCFDVNSDGKIHPDEFVAGLKDQGVEVNEDLVNLCFYLVDDDSSGFISEREFNRFFMEFAFLSGNTDFYDMIGCAADINGDSNIDPKELKRVMQFKGIQIPADLEKNLKAGIQKPKFIEFLRRNIKL